MKLQDCPIDSQIEITTLYGGKSLLITAYVIAVDRISGAINNAGVHSYNSVIGWKEKQEKIGWIISPSSEGGQGKEWMDKGYTYAWYANINDEVKLLSAAAGVSMHSGGMVCAIQNCKTFCPYATPNTSDGKFICFSCRSNGYHV